MDIRYATADDIKSFYEGRDNYGFSMRAAVAVDNDEVVGMAGVYYQYDGVLVAFSDIKESMRKRKKDVVRLGRLVMQMIINRKIPVVALCEEQQSYNILRKLGFEEFMTTERGRVMKWQP